MAKHPVRATVLMIFLATLLVMIVHEFLEESWISSGALSTMQAHAVSAFWISFWIAAISYLLLGRFNDLHSTADNAAAELQDSIARFQRMVDGAHDGHWEWYIGTDEKYYLSPRWKEFLGFEDHELPCVPASFFTRIHPDDKERVDEAIRKHLEESVPYEIELRLRCKDNGYRWFYARGQASRDERGRPIAMAGSITDITPRKRIEQERDRLHAQLESLINAAPVGIALHDCECRIVAINPALSMIDGLSLESHMGCTPGEILPSRVANMVEQNLRHVLKSGQVMNDTEFSIDNLANPGKLSHYNVSYFPVFVSKDEIVGVGALVQDVTGRKRADDALRASHEHLQNILEKSLDGYWQVDMQGFLVNVNTASCTLLGYTKTEMLCLRIADIEALENEEDIQAHIDKILQIGSDRFESQHRRKDGRIIDVEISVNLLHFNQSIHAFIRDISGRKSAERILFATRNEAQRANEVKSQFLALVSHELRTPMNGILGMLELALDSDSPAEQKEFLEVAQSSAQNMLVLLNDILDVSKIENGKLTIEQVPFDIRGVLSEAAQALALNAGKKGVDFFFHIDEQVPSNLVGDPVRLLQIINNLVGNAIKFTHQGHIVLKVHTERLDANGVLLGFIIQDTGIGIAREDQLSIFDAFTQTDASTTRQYGGTGLGLTICRQLVTLMGGNISVDSQLGVGSVFLFTAWFTILKEPLPNEAGGASQTQSLPLAEICAGIRLNILLAEDVPANQKYVMTVLAKAGHAVMLAQNGEEAITLAKSHPFDVILMDVSMPVVDGFEATQAIRAHGIETPIIALTAHVVPGFRDRCTAAGMNDYLSKPVKSRDLLQKIMALHENHGSLASGNASDERKTPAEPALSVFDTAVALDMTDGDLSMLLNLLLLTREQITQQTPEIEVAAMAKDADNLKMLSHALKSSLGLIGGLRAQQACALLEKAAKNTDSDAFGDLLQKLKIELATLVPAIDDFVATQTQANQNLRQDMYPGL